MKTFIIALALATTAFAAPSVTAQTAPTAKVFYGDLNLDSAAGQAAFKVRVSRAAHVVCGGTSASDLGERTAMNACYAAAMHGAMAQAPMAQASIAGQQVASR